jgi:polysaccharide biosynthesis protein PslH
MEILFISRLSPNPQNGGASIRSYGLLKGFSEACTHLTAVVPFNEKEDAICKEFKDKVTFYNYNYPLYHQIFPFYKDPVLMKIIRAVLLKNRISHVIIDYQFFGQYIQFFKEKKIKVIYGTHNSQAELVKQKKYNNIFLGKLNQLVWLPLVKLHERKYFNKADKLIVVSEQDFNYHCEFVKKNKIHIIPNFLVEDNYAISLVKKENYIIFTGSFYSFQNQEGLIWFLKEVWNEELKSKCQLLIVGNNSIEYLKSLHVNEDKILAVGMVEDIKPYIAKAKVAIVPLCHGSGTRLKCIEAMALRTRIISTTKGAEGLVNSNDCIVIADDPNIFRKKIMESIEQYMDASPTTTAYQIFLDNYSLKCNKKNIIELLV